MDLQRYLPFRGGIWTVDSEFRQPDHAALPEQVHCIVATNCTTLRTYKWWHTDLERMEAPEFLLDPEALFVCYSAAAELQAMQFYGWPMPTNLLDAFAEYLLAASRTKIAGQPPPGRRLVDALRYFGLYHKLAADKEGLQQLAQRGLPFTHNERFELTEYCWLDTDALRELLSPLMQRLSAYHRDWDRYLARMLFRGDYMKAVSEMQRRGIPLDGGLLCRVQTIWQDIRGALIQEVDQDFGVYKGMSFNQKLFGAYLDRNKIPWPKTPTGRYRDDDDTWKAQTTVYPQLQPLRELTATLGKLKLNKIDVGPDDRCRVYLNPFGSNTARNQPSNSVFPFGPATWIRGFIRPKPGRCLLYLDWKSQEIAVAAALSGDPNLIEDYVSGDFYTSFGTRTGFLPPGATKKSHELERDLLKRVCLGLNYGSSAVLLSSQLATEIYQIRKWIEGHRLRYIVFWEWIDDIVSSAYARGWIRSRLGWQCHVLSEAKPTSLMNWQMQTHGSDMLKAAAVMATKQRLSIVAPIHDALLLEAPAQGWQEHARALRTTMERASELILPGGMVVPVDGDDQPILYPHRYMDEKRGRATWDRVMGILDRLEPARETGT